jgi:hypothetical protein
MCMCVLYVCAVCGILTLKRKTNATIIYFQPEIRALGGT